MEALKERFITSGSGRSFTVEVSEALYWELMELILEERIEEFVLSGIELASRMERCRKALRDN